MAFEIYDPSTSMYGRGKARNLSPLITVTRTKSAYLNMTALDHLGDATRVQILHDTDRNVFAIRPCENDAPGARALTRQRGSAAVSLYAFLNSHRIELTHSVTLPTFIEDGLLCADFSQLLPVTTTTKPDYI